MTSRALLLSSQGAVVLRVGYPQACYEGRGVCGLGFRVRGLGLAIPNPKGRDPSAEPFIAETPLTPDFGVGTTTN